MILLNMVYWRKGNNGKNQYLKTEYVISMLSYVSILMCKWTLILTANWNANLFLISGELALRLKRREVMALHCAGSWFCIFATLHELYFLRVQSGSGQQGDMWMISGINTWNRVLNLAISLKNFLALIFLRFIYIF